MNKIQALQNLDPIDIVEKTGGNLWDAIALMGAKTEALNKLYDESDDTKFSETTENYMRICKSLGFVIIYEKPYLNTTLEPSTETNYVMYHPKYHLLLHWDTFQGQRNSANLYFNLFTQKINFPDSCSGGFRTDYTEDCVKVEFPFESPDPLLPWKEFCEKNEKYNEKVWEFRKVNNLWHVFVGDKDVREGLRFTIDSLLEQGKLISWIEKPFLWFLTSEHTKEENYDYNKINNEIISQFPQEVRDDLKL